MAQQGRGRRILLIDDDLDLLVDMAAALRAGGFEVVEAGDGEEGLWLFRREPVDLVVTALIMPDVDGLLVIADVKAMRPDVKVIATSDGARLPPEAYLRASRFFGADDTLAKPFAAEALVAAALRLLRPS